MTLNLACHYVKDLKMDFKATLIISGKTTYQVDTTVFDVKSYFLDTWGFLHQAKPDGLAFFMLSCIDNTYPTLLTIIDYPQFDISITFAL